MASTKKPLKILYFVPGVHFGGVERVLLTLLEKLDRSDFEPLVVTGGKGSFSKALEQAGIRHCPIRSVRSNEAGFMKVLLNFFPNLIRIARILRKEKPDLIHDVTPDGLVYLSLAARVNRIPLIWQPQIPQDQIRKRGRILQKASAYIKLDFIIFVGDFARKSYSSFTLPPWEIVPNSVDLKAPTQEERRRLRRKYQFPKNSRLVGLVARIIPGKGHEEFIQAVAHLRRPGQNLRFLIIGDPHIDPPFTRKLRKMVRELGLEGIVRFTGFLSPPGDFMSCLDLLVLPSRSELQGLVLLEAMACGVPVVASNIEAISDLINDGETGLLVPPEDVKSLARAVLTVLENPELRDRIVANASAMVQRDHSLGKNTLRISCIYRKLCSVESRPTAPP